MKLKMNKTVYGTDVMIARSGETGQITGFAGYQRYRQNQFLVEYTAADGSAVSDWFFEDELHRVS